MCSAVLNPKAPFYSELKRTWDQEFEDNYWAEDAIFMERNSRDFVSRIDRINANAEAVCDVLRQNSRGMCTERRLTPSLEHVPSGCVASQHSRMAASDQLANRVAL